MQRKRNSCHKSVVIGDILSRILIVVRASFSREKIKDEEKMTRLSKENVRGANEKKKESKKKDE